MWLGKLNKEKQITENWPKMTEKLEKWQFGQKWQKLANFDKRKCTAVNKTNEWGYDVWNTESTLLHCSLQY